MSLVFNLMDFDRVQQYALVITEGPFTGQSWVLMDNLDKRVPQIVSYAITSNSVSEEHKIVFTHDDQSTLELAIVGVSQCQITPGLNKSKPLNG